MKTIFEHGTNNAEHWAEILSASASASLELYLAKHATLTAQMIEINEGDEARHDAKMCFLYARELERRNLEQ